MATETIYQHLERHSDKRFDELFIGGTNIRASPIWHDRYVSRLAPDQIAIDRDIPLPAVYEAFRRSKG